MPWIRGGVRGPARAVISVREHRIPHPHNEASALLILRNQQLLDRLGWSFGLWIVSDEKRGHECVAALGRDQSDDTRWDVRALEGRGGDVSSRKTEDAEAMARAGSWIYLFGSQYGSKDGPLQPSRHWIARFNEAVVEFDGDSLSAPISVAKRPFLLHRVINDALRDSGIVLIDSAEIEREKLIAATVERGVKKDKRWKGLVTELDHPINIEAATFTAAGRLLLGLRYPVTRYGHPLLVEIDGIDRCFESQAAPEVTGVWEISNVGTKREPRGIRDLDADGSTVHVICGDLDSSPDRSVLLEAHPEGKRALSEHHTLELPAKDSRSLESRIVRRFDRRSDIEGLVLADDGATWYAADDEEILLFEVPQDRS